MRKERLARGVDWSTTREIAVVGLARSGVAATRLLASRGYRVYASDQSARTDISIGGSEGGRVVVESGGHDVTRIGKAAFVVVSPGVRPDSPVLERVRENGIPVISEVELALHFLPGLHYVAITGTNGKTTTTALVAHLLRAIGRDAVAAGNIGLPLSQLALLEQPPAWAALELSSFQLHDTPSIAPTVGLLTNLAPDHLDRYPSVDAYYADKLRLFANASADSRWVLNADCATCGERMAAFPGHREYFSTHQVAEGWYDRAARRLMLHDQPLLGRQELALLGEHNVANALAAALAVTAADPTHAVADRRERIADGLRQFRALPHRLEPIARLDDVLWIDDSKATNVASTVVALQGMQQPVVLLLGGRHKGEPYTALADEIRRTVKRVIAYGEAGLLVAEQLADAADVVLLEDDFEAVIATARASAVAGDAILLSPACSSYDMFRDYEHRGEMFRALAVRRGG